jgi:hypothetical protein
MPFVSIDRRMIAKADSQVNPRFEEVTKWLCGSDKMGIATSKTRSQSPIREGLQLKRDELTKSTSHSRLNSSRIIISIAGRLMSRPFGGVSRAHAIAERRCVGFFHFWIGAGG